MSSEINEPDALKQSAWKRAVLDTKATLESGWFWVLDILVAGALAYQADVFDTTDTAQWFQFVVFLLVFMVVSFLWNLLNAPRKQRNELRSYSRAIKGEISGMMSKEMVPDLSVDLWNIGRVYMEPNSTQQPSGLSPSEIISSGRGGLTIYSMATITNRGSPSRALKPILSAVIDGTHFNLNPVQIDTDLALDSNITIGAAETIFSGEIEHRPLETRVISDGDSASGWVVGHIAIADLGVELAESVFQGSTDIRFDVTVEDVRGKKASDSASFGKIAKSEFIAISEPF